MIEGNDGAERSFCSDCGSSLFYKNAKNLPGLVDICSATLDQAADFAPSVQIQTVDRLDWNAHVHKLPAFEGFPPMGDE